MRPNLAPTPPAGAASPHVALIDLAEQLQALREDQGALAALAELVCPALEENFATLETVNRRGLGQLLQLLAQEIDIALAGAEDCHQILWDADDQAQALRAPDDAPAGE